MAENLGLQRAAGNWGLPHFSCADDDKISRAALVICHLQTPFPSQLEFAIDILEKLARYDGGLTPDRGVVRLLLADVVGVKCYMMDVGIIFWRQGKCRRELNVLAGGDRPGSCATN